MARRFIRRKSNTFKFRFENNKRRKVKSLFAAGSSGRSSTRSFRSGGFFIPFATGKPATMYVDSFSVSTASLIGFGNCSCEHTQIIKTKTGKRLLSLKNHFYFTVPTSCRLKKIVANFSAYEVNIHDETELFGGVCVAMSKGVGRPFELIESTKTLSEIPLKKSASCLKPQEVFAVSDNMNVCFDFSDRVAICLMLKSKGKILDKTKVNLFCSGSLLFR